MSRAHPVVTGGHLFQAGDSARTIETKSGRRRILRLCHECGKPPNAPLHRPQAQPGYVAPPAVADPVVADLAPLAAPLPVSGIAPHLVPLEYLPALAPPPSHVHAGSLALALALDAVLAAHDTGGLTPPAVVYATALRAMLEVPRFALEAPEEEEDPQGVRHREAVRAVADVRAKVQVSDRLVAYRDPAPDYASVPGTPWAPRPEAQAPVQTSARARAREVTKGIRNDRVRELATRAVAQGWTPRKTGDGHLRLEHAGHPPLVLSMTGTADGRSWRNARAAARRRGLDVAGL